MDVETATGIAGADVTTIDANQSAFRKVGTGFRNQKRVKTKS